MSRKTDSFDARNYSNKKSVLKRAEFPVDPEEEPQEEPEKSKGPEELPEPPEKLPGAPKQTMRPGIPGQTSESLDIPGYTEHHPTEQTGLSPEEFKEKQQELGDPRQGPEPEVKDLPEKPSNAWKAIGEKAKERLKEYKTEDKAKERMEERFGPSEQLQEIAQGLEEFGRDLTTVDIEAAREYINRQELPELMEERLTNLLRGRRYAPNHPLADEEGEVPIAPTRIMQHTLNQLGATTRKDVQSATEWIETTDEGQQYLQRAREQYLVQSAMTLLKNTILKQKGEGTIPMGPRRERESPEQRTEKKRIDKLKNQLEQGTITQEQFDRRLKGEEAEEEPEEKKPARELKPTVETDPTTRALNQLQQRFNTGAISEEEYKRERARLLRESGRLNLRRYSDTEGPGGEDWWPGYEDGPQLNREKYKKKNRFPFHNEPAADIRTNTGPAKHDLPVPDGDSPAGDDNWGLLAAKETFKKTGNNDLFECYSYGHVTKGPWFTYTIFKQAYQMFRPGDIVVQYGQSPTQTQTYRRRFRSIKNARANLNAALFPAMSAIRQKEIDIIAKKAGTRKAETKRVLPDDVRLPGKPTPEESLHEQQKDEGGPHPGVYGPYTGPYEEMPWQGNRDGFDRPDPRRKMDTERNVFPFEDSEISNQTKIFRNLNLRKTSQFEDMTDQELTQFVNTKVNAFLKEIPERRREIVREAVDRYMAGDTDVTNPSSWPVEGAELYSGIPRAFYDFHKILKWLQEFEDIKKERSEIDLPSNLPEGLARKLNLQKRALKEEEEDNREEQIDPDVIAPEKFTEILKELETPETQFAYNLVPWTQYPRNEENPQKPPEQLQMRWSDLPPGVKSEWLQEKAYHHQDNDNELPVLAWADLELETSQEGDETTWVVGDMQSDVMQRSREFASDYRTIVQHGFEEISKKLKKAFRAENTDTAKQLMLGAIQNNPPTKEKGVFGQHTNEVDQVYYQKIENAISAATTTGQLQGILNKITEITEGAEGYPIGTRSKIENYYHNWDKELLKQTVLLAKERGVDTLKIPTPEERGAAATELTDELTKLFTRLYSDNVKEFFPNAKKTDDGQYWEIPLNAVTKDLFTTSSKQRHVKLGLKSPDWSLLILAYTPRKTAQDLSYWLQYAETYIDTFVRHMQDTDIEEKIPGIDNIKNYVYDAWHALMDKLPENVQADSQLMQQIQAHVLQHLENNNIPVPPELLQGGAKEIPREELPSSEEKFDLPGNMPPGIARKLNLQKQSEVGNYAAPVPETPEERAAKPEQDVPKPINQDPKRPMKEKRKRYDLNESQLYNQTEHADEPLTHYTSQQKYAFDFQVNIFHPQTGAFVDETVISANTLAEAQERAQEFINKGFPGYSFTVQDPYNETPRTLDMISVQDTNIPTGASEMCAFKKHALYDLSHPNQLVHIYLDALQNYSNAELKDIDTLTQGALEMFTNLNPDITQEEMLGIAASVDDMLNKAGVPSNFVNTLQGKLLS